MSKTQFKSNIDQNIEIEQFKKQQQDLRAEFEDTKVAQATEIRRYKDELSMIKEYQIKE